MSDDDLPFEPRLGRMGHGRSRKSASRALQAALIARIARAGGDLRELVGSSRSGSTGRFNSRGRGSRVAVPATASGWSVDPVSRMRVRSRRVLVKARVVKLAGAKALASAGAHLRYLQRDGVARDGEPGRFYATFSEDADGRAFLARTDGDRHQFRFIVSPEGGAAFDTLRGFTRQLMARMERDLGTTLDWIAVDHFDTGHPHTHVLVRGATEDGRTLNMAGDYIAHGIRGRAGEIMTRLLGPQSELELREQLAHEIDAERLTRLDRDLLARAEGAVVDLAQPARWDRDGAYQQLLIGRARRLEQMELAEGAGPLTWRLAPDLDRTLTELGRRGDIVRTLHRAMTKAKLQRRPELYVIDRPEAGSAPVIGRVVHRGATGDHHDHRFIVVDGIDGRTHYLEIGTASEAVMLGSLISAEPASGDVKPADRTIAEVARESGGAYSAALHRVQDPAAREAYALAHVRRLEALRRAGVAVMREPDGTWRVPPSYLDDALAHEHAAARAAPVRVQMLAMLDLEQQAVAQAPTWLDRQLTGTAPVETAAHGYGREVRQALLRRQQWLLAQGLAALRGDQVEYRADMEDVLRRREISTAAMRFSNQLGLPFAEAMPGERIAGICRRRVDLSSGSYALVENAREFTLVPWRPVLERWIGREVTGVWRGSGGISWTLGRERSGPSLGL